MIRKIKLFFGIYDLRNEGFRWACREFGEEYGKEFLEKYDKINMGIPIGGLKETAIFLYMVDDIKAICDDKKFTLRTLYEKD